MNKSASRIPVLRKNTALKPIEDIQDEDEEEDETDFIMEQVRLGYNVPLPPLQLMWCNWIIYNIRIN